MTTAEVYRGDKRFDYAAAFLERNGVHCRSVTADEAAGNADFLILPLPMTDDRAGQWEEWLRLYRGKRVFGGKCGEVVRAAAKKYGVRLTDYCAYEPFAVRNAVPTAEGAIEILLRETDFTLCGARVLVCGFGRIGRALAGRLQALGSDVTVTTRDPASEAWCEAQNLRAVPHRDIRAALAGQQIVCSTVPVMLFDRKLLAAGERDALFIDLSGHPGSIDMTAAEALGIRALQAFGLPGKTAPRTAGEIIGKCILKLWKEEDAYGTTG